MSLNRYYHLVARVRWGRLPFLNDSMARMTWACLEELFPDAVSAILMGNHLHLTIQTADPDGAHRRMFALARRVSIHAGVRELWEPIPEPSLVHDRAHLQRTIRYQLLNRCRARLDPDPIRWPWSTFRDGIGAVARPWVTPVQVGEVLKCDVKHAGAKLFQYVNQDSFVEPAARAALVPAVATRYASHGLPAIRDAALAAYRVSNLKRRSPALILFFHLARKVGFQNAAELARFAGTVRTTVHNGWDQNPGPAAMAAGLLCLGDPRLRAYRPEGE